MKKIQTYNSFLNESLKVKLKGKSDEEILNNLISTNKKDHKLFINSCEYGSMDGIIYSFNNLPYGVLTQDIINWGMRRAAYNGHLDIVKYLIEEKGADIHDTNDHAFRNACENGDVDMVKYLVEKGANINVEDNAYLGWRLTLRGRGPEHKEIMDYLIDIDNKR
jgi:ankyrin repeat protein